MSTDTATISDAKTWCTNTRKVLNLSRKERNQLDLKSRSSAAVDNLNKLQGKVPQPVYDKMKKQLLEIAGRLRDAKSKTDPEVAVDAERLNVLACETKCLLKDDKSTQKDLDKALTGLSKSLVGRAPTTGTPEERGKALAVQIAQMAEKGGTIAFDVKAMSNLSKTANPGSDEQKLAAAACKHMVELNDQKMKSLGARAKNARATSGCPAK